jgi:hypothetical protein
MTQRGRGIKGGSEQREAYRMHYPTLAGGTCQATRITHIIVTLRGTHMDKMYEITVANRSLPEVAGYRPVVLYIAVRATAFATTITHEQSFQQTVKRQRTHTGVPIIGNVITRATTLTSLHMRGQIMNKSTTEMTMGRVREGAVKGTRINESIMDKAIMHIVNIVMMSAVYLLGLQGRAAMRRRRVTTRAMSATSAASMAVSTSVIGGRMPPPELRAGSSGGTSEEEDQTKGQLTAQAGLDFCLRPRPQPSEAAPKQHMGTSVGKSTARA